MNVEQGGRGKMCLFWSAKNISLARSSYGVECRELPNLVLTALKFDVELRDKFVGKHCYPLLLAG
jgi:hypothetical protein